MIDELDSYIQGYNKWPTYKACSSFIEVATLMFNGAHGLSTGNPYDPWKHR